MFINWFFSNLKKRVFNVFILGINVFLHLGLCVKQNGSLFNSHCQFVILQGE